MYTTKYATCFIISDTKWITKEHIRHFATCVQRMCDCDNHYLVTQYVHKQKNNNFMATKMTTIAAIVYDQTNS